MRRELIVDVFAGGGGASHGIRAALGRSPDIAINHDPEAIAMHAANHPDCRHITEDVWKADPRRITKGRKIGLLWASPDCKHFSRAKGSKPVEKTIRSLAWVVVKWAAEQAPRIIMLENVREFAEWGPIVPAWRCGACKWRGTEGQAVLARGRRRCPRCESLRLKVTDELIPDPSRKGLTFRRWLGRLRNLGYNVEWKNLNAADYGAPTHRRRLFLIARRDGEPIVWPVPTHGDPKKLDAQPLFDRLKPWRTAAECIDWSVPCPSIFTRKRPLKEATLRRIALGIKRYVLDNPEPFIVRCNHGGEHFRGQRIEQPMPTLTGSKSSALVMPCLMPVTHVGDRKSHDVCDPLPTITGAHRGEFALISPTLIQTGYGEREGQSPRVPGLDKPLGSVVAGGAKHAVVAAFLAKHFGGVVGVPVDTPLPTTTTRACQNQVVAANLVRMNNGEKQWNGVDEPAVTVTSQTNKIGLVATNLVRFNHDDAGLPIDAPLPTVTVSNHAALVYSFLVRYFGTAIGQHVTEPLYTITGKDRFGLVTVTIGGELWAIVDIGMRMLTPRELARAQGFPDSYILTGTKTSQVARIGNSVPPTMAEVLVRANFCREAVLA